jgi:AbrB family transcriptional regulator (stage V sporulation protein T)
MKATGIVRRIDDLGRIVIPKEIRKTFHIKESDPMEIFINGEGEIILKKYSPMGEMSSFAKQYTDSLAQASGHVAIITDRDTVVAVSGGMKDCVGKRVSKGLEECMQNRDLVIASKGQRGFTNITEESREDICDVGIGTILASGDVAGSVCLVGTKGQVEFGEIEKKLIQTATGFIGKQLEV